MHRTFGLVIALSAVALAGCQKADPATQQKLDRALAKLDTIEKKLTTLEQRGVGGAQQPQRRRADPNTVYYLPIDPLDPQVGAKHAKVTIVEAFEFACPYCAMVAGPISAAVEKHKADVKYVGKQFIIHPDIATDSGLAACAAQKQGSDKYHAFETKLWQVAWPTENDRPKMVREKLTADAMKQIAKEVGLNVDKFSADVQSAECKGWLEKNRQQLSAVGVSGTPSIYINGKPYQGGRTPDAISAAIEQEIKKADAAIASGVKLEEYYDSLMKNAKKSL